MKGSAYLPGECGHSMPERTTVLLLCSKDVPRLYSFTDIAIYYSC